MRKAVLFIVFCAATCFAQAQSYNAKPGFIIKLNGDTLRGMIRDRVDLSTSVAFKATSDADFTTYTPNDIQAFYLETGYFYQAKAVQANEQFFLLTLANGTLNLYQQPGESIFYLQKEAGDLRKLEKRDSLIGTQYKYDFRYRNILSAFTADCPAVSRSISRANLTDRDLQRIVNEYNNCIAPDRATEVFKAPVKLHVQIGAKAGWYSNKLRFVTTTGYYRENSAPVENSLSGGVFARFFFKEKWAVQPEVLFTKKEGTVDGRTVFGTGDIGVFSFSYLQIPLSIYYTFPTNKIKPFLFGGAVAGFAVDSEAYRIRDDQQLSIPFSLDTNELGFRGGTGVQWQLKSSFALQLEYLYETTLANKNSVNNKINHRGHSVKLGVLF